MERSKPARRRLTEALLEILEDHSVEDTTVVDLCSKANVSRSTFYTYFSSVDDVYRELVRELFSETSMMRPQLRCAECSESQTKHPLCVLIRGGGRYTNLTNDNRFLRTLIDVGMAEFRDESIGIFTEACEDDEEAFALYCYQMMGCVGAALMVPDSFDWERMRNRIDAFIRGGLNSVKNS